MAKEKVQVKMNADEIKEHLKHLIKNNEFIQATGKVPIALNVEGEAGLGKTSVVIQTAEELKYQYVKKNLAEIEETGDLQGFPLRQFELCKDSHCLWVDEMALIQYTKQGYEFTGKKRMGYCPPDWIADKGENGILFLDDFSRADSRIIQCAMELINRQEFGSWKLPKGWTIVLSSNPDNGHYMVNSQDVAHQSRYSTIVMKWDVECWARQAERDQIDGRCINFMLKNSDIMKDENLREGINPRSMTNFFNSIASIPDFEVELAKIQQIGESSIGPEATTLFTTFINQKLDKIISPKEMLEKDWKTVKQALKDSHGEGKKYRPDIGSILTTRLINYSLHYAEKGTVDQKMINRIVELTTDNEVLASDLKYFVIKQLLGKNKQKFQKLMLDPGIIKMSVK